jgi:hypothetical protein
VQKFEIGPKGFALLAVKTEIEKINKNQSAPKLLTNAELYGLVLTSRQKKGYYRIWEANLQPFLGLNNKPKMLKVGPKFFQP